MLHPWQGALRKIKKLLIAQGLEVVGWRSQRWWSRNFEGWRFQIYVMPPVDNSTEVDGKLQDMEIEFFGYLLADMCLGGEEHWAGQKCLMIEALLLPN